MEGCELGGEGAQGRTPRMNKAQLILRVQRHMGLGCTRETARAAVDAVLDSIVEASKLGRLELRGFGVFDEASRSSRSIMHPGTGENVATAPKRRLRFRASTSVSSPALRKQLES